MTFAKFIGILVFWVFFAIVVFLIALSMGLYAHPLVRVNKKLKKAKKHLLLFKERLSDGKKEVSGLAEIKRAEVRTRHATRLLDTYIYDTKEPSLKVSDGKSHLDGALRLTQEAEKEYGEGRVDKCSTTLEAAVERLDKAVTIFKAITEEESKGRHFIMK